MDPWPREGLESVPACPACSSSERSALHRDLSDRVFRVAPGEWSLYSCERCGAAYLDPRPTRESIGLAYRDYPTATPSADPLDLTGPGRVGRIKSSLRNGYVNGRYGYSLTPALAAGRMILPLLPRRKEGADASIRDLPRGTTLLDVGCGNGDFARSMSRVGWVVQGLEPDPVAAEVARAAGVPVFESSLEDADLPSERFEAITMNHVVEHLHDPASALANCRRALTRDGLLWIATPNLGSLGHRLYRSDWLHLDPPRHLVLFDKHALERLLVRSGFRPVRWLTRRSAEFSFANSAALARGERLFAEARTPGSLRLRARAADLLTLVSRRFAEELVVLARRAQPNGSPS